MMKVSDDLQKGCHEAIQIYALVEADAERQAKKRPSFRWRKATDASASE